MLLQDVLWEQDLKLTAVNDANSANRFLSRVGKIVDRGEVQVQVREKLKKLEDQLKELVRKDGEDSERVNNLNAAIEVLKKWTKKNPLANVPNPANRNFGVAGGAGSSGDYYDSGNGNPSN